MMNTCTRERDKKGDLLGVHSCETNQSRAYSVGSV